MASASTIMANSERDIGPLPKANLSAINKWNLFYTNIERVKAGLLPLAYYAKLEQAANWIAEYCATKLSDISHSVNAGDMADLRGRLAHFGVKARGFGENLTISFRSNTESVMYYTESDSQGTYRDYRDYKIFWRNERQLAYAMVDAWMHSPGHRDNIMTAAFTAMGGGVGVGDYRSMSSAYGAQVFVAARVDYFDYFKAGTDGKSFAYSGKFTPVCFSIRGDEPPTPIKLQRQRDVFTCAAQANESGEVYAGLFDGKESITYPVMVVQK